MEDNIKILHISDIHLNGKNSETIRERLSNVAETVKRDVGKIDMIFISGDLVNDGKDESYEILYPILNNFITVQLGLPLDKIVMVPGNHDIDRDAENDRLEKSIDEDASNILSDEYLFPIYKKKILAFEKFRNKFSKYQTGVLSVKRINSVICVELDSALFASQSRTEHGSLYISTKELEKIPDISNSDSAAISIACIHHPMTYLTDLNRKNVEAHLVKKIDILLHGHVHDEDEYSISKAESTYRVIACPAIHSSKIKDVGFNLIEYYPGNGENESLKLSTYKLDQNKNSFAASELMSGYLKFLPKNKRTTLDNKIIDIRSDLPREESIDGIFDVLPLNNTEKVSFSELFYPNDIRKISKSARDEGLLNVRDIIHGPNNYILSGPSQSGKSAMLKYFYNEMIIGNSLNYIPVLLDMNKLTGGESVLIGMLKKEIKADDTFFDEILRNNKLVILIDNMDSDQVRPKSKQALYEYIKKNKIRFIGSTKESIMGSLLIDDFTDIEYIPCSIDPINISFLRGALTKWKKYFNFEQEAILQQTISIFSKLRIPRTPMSLLMVFNILQNKSHKVSDIENEYALVDTYLRILLGAFDSEEVESSKIRDSFLRVLSYEMYKRRTNDIPVLEFEKLKIDFVEKRGHPEALLKKLDLLFNKKIIIKTNNETVRFSFDFYFYFFLSKCLMENQSLFDELIKNEKDIVLYLRSLEYISDLQTGKAELLEIVNSILLKSLKEKNELYTFDEFEKTELSTYVHEMVQDLKGHVETNNSNRVVDSNHEGKLKQVDSHDHRVNHDSEVFHKTKSEISKILHILPYYARLTRNLIDCGKENRISHLENLFLFYRYIININLKFLKFIFDSPSLRHMLLRSMEKYGDSNEENVSEIIKFMKDMCLQRIPPILLLNLSENASSITLTKVLEEISNSSKNTKDIRLMAILVIFFTNIRKGIELLNDWYRNSENLKSRYMNAVVFWTLNCKIHSSKLSSAEKDLIASVFEKLIKRGEDMGSAKDASEMDMLMNKESISKSLKTQIREKLDNIEGKEIL